MIVNNHELRRGKPKFSKMKRTPTGPPGLIFFDHRSGQGREGWWDCERFKDQVVDLVDCFEILYLDPQLVFEVDWSAGHSKSKEDGLNTLSMNSSWGGKQPQMHSTSIEDEESPGEGSLLKVGDLQHLVFQDDEQPIECS